MLCAHLGIAYTRARCLPHNHDLHQQLASMQEAWEPLAHAAPLRDRLHREVMEGRKVPDPRVTSDTHPHAYPSSACELPATCKWCDCEPSTGMS